jgi:tetratricopeptide (TPR) repeat protein
MSSVVPALPRHRLAAALCVVATVASGGCARPQGSEVKSGLKTMEREQTEDKLFERGKAFAMVGDYTRAEQYLVAALDAKGDERKIMPVLLKVLIAAERYRDAIEHCEGYLKKHSGDVRLRFVLATLYNATGEVAKARDALVRVVSTDPANAEAHYSLAVLLRDEDNDLGGADLHFREYLKLSPRGQHADEARGSLLKSVH